MKTNVNIVMDEIRSVEAAMQKVKGQVLLIEDSHSKIWLQNGQLYRQRPQAGRSWICRKITAAQLVRIAPARRLLEILREQ